MTGMVNETKAYIDFKIRTEPWNSYKLKDGTILKTRVVMVTAKKSIPQTGTKNYGADFKSLRGYIIPPKNFSEPSSVAYSEEDYKSPDNLIDINFTTISEKLSEYELDDGTLIKAKLDVKAIKKSKLHLQDGSPFYVLMTDIWHEMQHPPK